MLIKYIKSVLWRVAKCLSYIEEARCLKVKNEEHEMVRHVAGIDEKRESRIVLVGKFGRKDPHGRLRHKLDFREVVLKVREVVLKVANWLDQPDVTFPLQTTVFIICLDCTSDLVGYPGHISLSDEGLSASKNTVESVHPFVSHFRMSGKVQ